MLYLYCSRAPLFLKFELNFFKNLIIHLRGTNIGSIESPIWLNVCEVFLQFDVNPTWYLRPYFTPSSLMPLSSSNGMLMHCNSWDIPGMFFVIFLQKSQTISKEICLCRIIIPSYSRYHGVPSNLQIDFVVCYLSKYVCCMRENVFDFLWHLFA